MARFSTHDGRQFHELFQIFQINKNYKFFRTFPAVQSLFIISRVGWRARKQMPARCYAKVMRSILKYYRHLFLENATFVSENIVSNDKLKHFQFFAGRFLSASFTACPAGPVGWQGGRCWCSVWQMSLSAL